MTSDPMTFDRATSNRQSERIVTSDPVTSD